MHQKNYLITFHSFFSINKHPSIAPFVGFVISCDKIFLLFKSTSKRNINKNYLSNFGNKKFSSLEDALVFTYRIACGFEFLHNNNFYIKNFNPKYVLLINNFPIIYFIDL